MVGVLVPPAVQDSELEGQAVPNQFYVGQRLGYSTGGAESLDPLNSRFIGALLLHWAIVFTIFLVGSGAIVLLGRILGSVTLMGLLLAVWWLVMGVVAWWFPIWASISEWKFMVDGKASAAATAFQHITWAFEQRRSPVDRVRVHRLSFGRTRKAANTSMFRRALLPGIRGPASRMGKTCTSGGRCGGASQPYTSSGRC